MTQILNRRTLSATALGTLSDQGAATLDAIYGTLLHKAFLFEYKVKGTISTALIADFLAEDGISIILIQTGLSTTDMDTILTGAQITDTSMSVDIPSRQRIFALAEIRLTEVVSATDGTLEFQLHFKPKSKGGIPFTEGSGWQLRIINRSGSTLTTGNNVANMTVFERFAYEGGGGA